MKNSRLVKSATFLIIIIFAGVTFIPLTEGNILKTNRDNHQFILNFSSSSDEIVARVPLLEPSTLGRLIDHKITILSVEKSKISAIILVSNDEFNWLETMGFSPEFLYNNLAEMDGWKDNPQALLQFHNYDQMTAELQNIADTYPTITNLYDLGHSVLNRVLWGLKISDNPDIEEDEPEVRICGLHHGNEYMGAELPLLLAQHLTQNYGSNPDITNLVDNREIWIIPMVNPDGREAGTRGNSNGVDLNRDYGYMWESGWGSPSPFSQPETKAMRINALENNFVLSLSYHCSGDIVNYIWNYKLQSVPDVDAVEFLSEQFGSHNGYWVTDGYDWYQTRGDTNDFSYGCRGDIDWTIEVQNSDIQGAWNKNKDAMLEIIDAADMGLRGIVTDSITGQPIAATIWVDEAYWPCFTDPQVGDYHRVLLTGTYNVHYRANGYTEQTFTVEVDSDEPTILDVALDPGIDHYAYQVTLCNFYDPMIYPNNFQNNPTEAISALGPPDEICASLGVGGTIVLDMNEEIIDVQNSPDFKVIEGGDTNDGYRVYVSANWDGPWTDMGLATGTVEFDLADVSVGSARYIKIVDDGNGSPSETFPGVDIDAVENLAAENAPYIPEKPDGPTSGVINVEYEFGSITTDPQGDQLFYMFDWGDGTFSEWLGPYPSGTIAAGVHSWQALGTYEIKVKAKDTNGATSGWSEPLILTIIEDQKPYNPTITGETNGKINTYYTYSFLATDPDQDDLYYYIDWGDNNTEEWIGPYNSGEEFSIAHSWTEKGMYIIKAKVKDEHGSESDWAALEVIMPRNKIISNMLSYRLLGRFLFLGEILSRLTIFLR